MATQIKNVDTGYYPVADEQYAIADQLVREATVTLMQKLSADLPPGNTVCTSSCLSVLLQTVAMLMAEFDAPATSKILSMLGVSASDIDGADLAALQNAMQAQQRNLMDAELRMRAAHDVKGQA